LINQTQLDRGSLGRKNDRFIVISLVLRNMKYCGTFFSLNEGFRNVSLEGILRSFWA